MKQRTAPTSVRWLTFIKWGVFRLLETLGDLRGNPGAAPMQLDIPATAQPALWIYVSTIGELNAIAPLIDTLFEPADGPYMGCKLVLVTEHSHYAVSYRARFPAAAVCVTRGHARDARRLALHYPPRALIVGEIPCLPSDAPCRLSFAFLLEAKRHIARACVVNGWLYHYEPACRMDAIERWLFLKDYLRTFDFIAVQTAEARDTLIARGAPAARVHVTGNLKFDAVHRATWSPVGTRSAGMLCALVGSGRPVIVGGCLTRRAEQQMLLEAFAELRRAAPEALLILAPRHPEVAQNLIDLRIDLERFGLRHMLRSAIADTPIAPDLPCLVLDTMGELRDFYAAATVAHVGVDHNILEPLAFDKPVTVMSGWEATYPSYPVYRQMTDAGALRHAETANDLLNHWRALCRQDPNARSVTADGIRAALARNTGALERHLALLHEMA